MEVQRRHRALQIQDQENVYAIKGKGSVMPAKKQGLGVRGALGDINTNVQREVNVGKVASATAEFEKKATLNKCLVRSNSYSHVQSKIDTGLASKNVIQPSSRPPLRREESMAGHAARAVARTRAALKDTTNKPTESKESINIYVQTKKEWKKTTKLPNVKETKEKTLKPILKESTESLGKLKLADESKALVKQHIPLKPMLEVSPMLPDGIEDIDGNDDNPFIMAIYIKDIYKYLTELEEKYPIEPDHLRNQVIVTGRMRSTLMDWLVEVSRQFALMLETFQLTVGIIDRYLQAEPTVQRNKLQLVGVTAMLIASKYEEIYAPDVTDFIYISDKAYSSAEIFQCERQIMSKLGFCLARPIPLSFLRRFIKAAKNVTSKNHHLAKYFVDLSLIEYTMAHYRPSELAAAAVCLSLHLISGDDLEDVWTPTLSYYSGYTLKHITPIIRKLAKIVINVDKSKYKAVYNRYLEPTVAKVANLPHLKSDAIYELADEAE